MVSYEFNTSNSNGPVYEINGNPCAFPCIIGVLLLLALFGYFYIIKNKRKEIIKKLKTNPAISEGAPVLLEATAVGPARELPSSGEKVAFYGLSVISKKGSLHGRIALKGIFSITTMSGNFKVRSRDGNEYTVDLEDYLGRANTYGKLVAPLSDYDAKMTLGSLEGEGKIVKTPSSRINSVLTVVFGSTVWKKRDTHWYLPIRLANILAPITITVFNPKSTVDIGLHLYTIGKDMPERITAVLKDNGILGGIANDGDEIYVIETYIPMGKNVYVLGTCTSLEKKAVSGTNTTTGFTVSYADPETL
jgi:hypothetical protein